MTDSRSRFVLVSCPNGNTREIRLINPATGETIPGVIDVVINIRDSDGKILPVPIATVKMYARVDVAASLKVLPVEWIFEDGKRQASLDLEKTTEWSLP